MFSRHKTPDALVERNDISPRCGLDKLAFAASWEAADDKSSIHIYRIGGVAFGNDGAAGVSRVHRGNVSRRGPVIVRGGGTPADSIPASARDRLRVEAIHSACESRYQAFGCSLPLIHGVDAVVRPPYCRMDSLPFGVRAHSPTCTPGRHVGFSHDDGEDAKSSRPPRE